MGGGDNQSKLVWLLCVGKDLSSNLACPIQIGFFAEK